MSNDKSFVSLPEDTPSTSIRESNIDHSTPEQSSESELDVKEKHLPTNTQKQLKQQNIKKKSPRTAYAESGDSHESFQDDQNALKNLIESVDKLKDDIRELFKKESITKESDEKFGFATSSNKTSINLSDAETSKQDSAVTELHSIQKRLDNLLTENNKLKSNLRNKEQQLIELSAKYEDLLEKLKTKQNTKSEDATQTESGESSWSLEPPVEAMQLSESEPRSLPVPRHLGNETSNYIQKIQALEISIKKSEGTIKQLKDMNFQWQLYNQQKEEAYKKLEEEIQEKDRIIERLRSQSSSGSSTSLNFNPSQQEFIDESIQRVRREADRYRDQYETTRRSVAEAKRLQEEAERKVVVLQNRITELTAKVNDQTTQMSELQTALVVATRSGQQQPSLEHELRNLKEAIRQYQEDIKTLNKDYQRVLEEKRILEQNQQSGPRFQQTIVNHRGGGTTTIQQSSRPLTSEVFSSENLSILDDIEIDSGAPHSMQYHEDDHGNRFINTYHRTM